MTTTPTMRDWIAVDQLLARQLDHAETPFARDVIRLAAETSGGPDPALPGGGPDWETALNQARATLTADQAPDDTADLDFDDDLAYLRRDIRRLLIDADTPAATVRDAAEQILTLLTDAIAEARRSDRATLADWMHGQAATLGGTVIAEAQARILSATADRIPTTAKPQTVPPT